METSLPSGITLLSRLMSAAGWHCNENRLFEAIPHMSDRLSAQDMAQTLSNLGVPTMQEWGRLKHVTADDCPALFIDPKHGLSALLDVDGDKVLLAEAGADAPAWHPAGKRRGELVRLEKFDNNQAATKIGSVADVTSGFRGLMPWLIFATFMSNVMGLATPLLIMVIYDRVIPAQSLDLVLSLIALVLVFLATDAGFRAARSNAIAHMGKETEQKLGLALFRKLMALPLDQIQKSDVEQQLARFKQFEGFRDVFTGQVLTTFLDLPFTLIFFGVLFWLSPSVALLILGLAVIFIIASWYFLPTQQKLGAQASQDRTALQTHVFEAATHQRAIQRLGLEARWQDKNGYLTERAVQSTARATSMHLLTQNIGQTLMAVAGIGAVCIGTLAAMRGDMSFGALIAIMSLVWKILTPLQALYTNIPQIFGYLRSKTQSDRVLAIPEELVRGVAQSHQKTFSGRVSLSGVTQRYDASSVPALSQVTLEIAPQEFAVICGDESSGRTTLLNLAAGFCPPTIGTVQLDDVDIRQIPVDDLRRSVTYGQPDLFYGTVFQNFRLAAPSLTEADVEDAIRKMGLEEVVGAFPDGLHTRLSEAVRNDLPSSTLHALALARSFARGGSVLMLNEPTVNLDNVRRDALIGSLKALRGTQTLLIASQDTDVIRMADRFIYLDQGRIVVNDVGPAARKKITALINRSKDV
ncbi:MAG: ABC transporter transmembrane domain-containing protein [Pseudomonadota bacterium]